MSRESAIRRIVALHAPGLRAEIRGKRALRYGNEPDSASGIASHVRAASAIRRQGSRLIVIQDDVNALAVIDASSCIMPLLLPPGADGRRSFDDTIGNKHLKMDLEAAVVLPDARVLAFGSGSTRARERIVVVESETGVLEDLHPLRFGAGQQLERLTPLRPRRCRLEAIRPGSR